MNWFGINDKSKSQAQISKKTVSKSILDIIKHANFQVYRPYPRPRQKSNVCLQNNVFQKKNIFPAKVVENCKVYSAQFRLLKIAFSSRKMEIKHFYSWPQANLFAMYLSSLPGQRKITHPTPKQYFLEKSISPSRKDSVIFIPIC